MLILDVPYAEKDEAKSLGAKWNPTLKKWTYSYRKNYIHMLKWLPEYRENSLSNAWRLSIACDNLCIVEASRTCFKCANYINVIGFSYDFILNFYGDFNTIKDSEYDNDLHIGPPDTNTPQYILDVVSQNFNFNKIYSKTTQSAYYANFCPYCKTLQGNFHLFNDSDGPFYITNKESAAKLKVHKIKLKHDFVLHDDTSWCSTDYLIKKYASFIGN